MTSRFISSHSHLPSSSEGGVVGGSKQQRRGSVQVKCILATCTV